MKNNKECKYIGFYTVNTNTSDRVCSLAAMSKMDYICSAMNRIGYSVNIISPSWIGKNSKNRYEKQHETKISDKIKVTFCPSFKSGNIISLRLAIGLSLVWLFFYLLLNTKRNEKVIAYHVPWISVPIRLAKYFKHFDLILEVEEIYYDLIYVNSIFTNWEKRLINAADSYFLSNDIMRNKINAKKRSIIIYGIYNAKKTLSTPICDGKIHVVYAGIIDSLKKGAFNAIEASKYLSEKYEMHIIGFGEVEKLCNRIKELNMTNACKIVYDGILHDDEYIKYCQSCHIGLSTQSMDGNYLESSFPSKILSYLSMGLHVVSCKILCVEISKIGRLVTLYSEDLPDSIAKAIQSVDLSADFDSRKRIEELDNGFMVEINDIICGEAI